MFLPLPMGSYKVHVKDLCCTKHAGNNKSLLSVNRLHVPDPQINPFITNM